jgi:type VI secretion system secreted protein VgrG
VTLVALPWPADGEPWPGHGCPQAAWQATMPPPIALTSPLGDDLKFESMTASSGLSTLGEMQLQLLSEKPDLAPEKLLGKPVTVAVQLREGKRFFNGYVSRFGLGRNKGRYFGYHATVRPWLWFLSRTTDCRIFTPENIADDGGEGPNTVPNIVKKVFKDHGIADFEFKLFRQYRPWTYCVQYRESDYNFVARLLEQEGIYWYFVHTDGKHKLMLVDSSSSHDPMPGYDTLPYFDNGAQVPPDTEYVSNWSCSREVKPGKTVLTSYDFERPSTSLKVDQAEPRSYSMSDYEQFDFQGDYVQDTDGKQYAENRLDEAQARYERLAGDSNAHGVADGHLFKLSHHPSEPQNAQYLCANVTIQAHVDGYEAGNGAGDFRCSFSAIPAAQQFRPARLTPKPFVQGPQTAIVVGPSGDEIHTDKYGRVKVQFHWDRYGKRNEKSSCWIRVSHPWAGKNFGMVDIPRIGQEVVVDFLEGDPDQPLITGRVYNAEQMHPWDLPANATQSGILTRSSKGGAYDNANAIRFEDKKGAEQLWIHAEKNKDIEVENDETHWVGQDRHKTVDRDETNHIKHDRTETVDNIEKITIGVDRVEKVGNNEIVTIGNDRTETIKGSLMATVNKTKSETVLLNSAETVGLARELTIGGLYQVSVGGAHNTTVGGIKSVEVGGYSAELVGGHKNLTVGGNHTETVRGQQSVGVKGDRSLKVDGKSEQVVKGEHSFKAKKISLTAEEEFVITVGKARFVMKKDGSVLVDGKDVDTKASGKFNVKASSDIILKGSNVKEN